MWDIEIDYITGDTFSTHNACEKVGHCWRNLDRAKESLALIKEFTDHYESCNSFRRKKNIKKPKWWKSDFNCPVITDDGDMIYISAFWVGYFESINSASITKDADDSLTVEF